jgi:pyruvate dehydrogenase E2 component (dihydrolipoamide acetyltransferase)
MPALGQTSDELRLVSWAKAVGEQVSEGETLFEVESDKATLEVEASVSGTLLTLCEPGQTVLAGTVLGWIGEPGEEPPDLGPSQDPVEDEVDARGLGATSDGRTSESPADSKSPTDERVPATPAARALARRHDVDLASLIGSGAGGRIERRDVEAALGRPRAEEPVPRHRQAIADRLLRAAAVPQFTVSRTIDVRNALKRVEGVERATLTHLILQAAAAALRSSPRVNRTWVEDGPRVRTLESCDVGLAIATEDNLIVATISEPDRVDLGELATRTHRIVEEARAGRLSAAATAPAALTISNLGMFGVDRFEAIVDPDQTAILAVGRIVERPAASDGVIEVVPQVELSLTVDHRTVDGVDAARFLSAVSTDLER